MSHVSISGKTGDYVGVGATYIDGVVFSCLFLVPRITVFSVLSAPFGFCACYNDFL